MGGVMASLSLTHLLVLATSGQAQRPHPDPFASKGSGRVRDVSVLQCPGWLLADHNFCLQLSLCKHPGLKPRPFLWPLSDFHLLSPSLRVRSFF